MILDIKPDGVEWGFGPDQQVKHGGIYFVYWWNWLPKRSRYLGIEFLYYDGPHWSFGLWFTNISWRLPCNVWEPGRGDRWYYPRWPSYQKVMARYEKE